MSGKSSDNWYTIAEAVGILGVSDRTIRRRIDKGELKTKLEGKVRYIHIDIMSSTMPDEMSSRELINQLKSENERLVQQLSEKDRQIEGVQRQLEETQKDVAEASHRHDTVVMQMTKMLEYHQQPFWQRWLKIKALPAPKNVVDMEPDIEEKAAPEEN